MCCRNGPLGDRAPSVAEEDPDRGRGSAITRNTPEDAETVCWRNSKTATNWYVIYYWFVLFNYIL